MQPGMLLGTSPSLSPPGAKGLNGFLGFRLLGFRVFGGLGVLGFRGLGFRGFGV